jgi:hypothetical protein
MQTLLTYVTSIDRGAELTIIAAAGSNPHYGLLGISRPRKPQAILSISSHTFVAVEDPSYEIQNSTWDRRAWTFQEALLSRRRLVFTDSQFYFQCLRMHCTEGIEHSHTLVYGALRDEMRAFPRRGMGHQAPDIDNRLRVLQATALFQCGYPERSVRNPPNLHPDASWRIQGVRGPFLRHPNRGAKRGFTWHHLRQCKSIVCIGPGLDDKHGLSLHLA